MLPHCQLQGGGFWGLGLVSLDGTPLMAHRRRDVLELDGPLSRPMLEPLFAPMKEPQSYIEGASFFAAFRANCEEE